MFAPEGRQVMCFLLHLCILHMPQNILVMSAFFWGFEVLSNDSSCGLLVNLAENLLSVSPLCLIDHRTSHCSIILWVNFGEVFAVWGELTILPFWLWCSRHLFNVVRPEKITEEYQIWSYRQLFTHTYLVWRNYVCRSSLYKLRDVCSSRPASSSETHHQTACFHLLCNFVNTLVLSDSKVIVSGGRIQRALPRISSTLAFLCVKDRSW